MKRCEKKKNRNGLERFIEVYWLFAVAFALSKASFFDFHAALTSFWCCSVPDDVMVTVDATGWEDKVRRVLAEKRLSIDELVEGKQKKDDQHLYFHLNAEDRIRVGAILCRASSAEQVSSPWTAAELDDTEFFWGAYTKLDNFYALSEDWLLPEQTAEGTKFRKRGRSS